MPVSGAARNTLQFENVFAMDIHINQKPITLPEGATVADALAAFGARPPFAVALNGDFVARTQHGARSLQAGDRLEIVKIVAGG